MTFIFVQNADLGSLFFMKIWAYRISGMTKTLYFSTVREIKISKQMQIFF